MVVSSIQASSDRAVGKTNAFGLHFLPNFGLIIKSSIKNVIPISRLETALCQLALQSFVPFSKYYLNISYTAAILISSANLLYVTPEFDVKLVVKSLEHILKDLNNHILINIV